MLSFCHPVSLQHHSHSFFSRLRIYNLSAVAVFKIDAEMKRNASWIYVEFALWYTINNKWILRIKWVRNKKKENNKVEVTHVNNHDSSPILVEAKTPSNLLLPDCINKRSIVLFGSTDMCDTEPTFFPLYRSTLNPVNNKTTETFYCPHCSYLGLFFWLCVRQDFSHIDTQLLCKCKEKHIIIITRA